METTLKTTETEAERSVRLLRTLIHSAAEHASPSDILKIAKTVYECGIRVKITNASELGLSSKGS